MEIEKEKLAALLLMDEANLDIFITQLLEISQKINAEELKNMLDESAETGIDITKTDGESVSISSFEFTTSLSAPSMGDYLGFFRQISRVKKNILGFPGKKIARAIRKYSADDCKSLCLKLKYCQVGSYTKNKLDKLSKIQEEYILYIDNPIDELNKILGDQGDFLDDIKTATDELLSACEVFLDEAIDAIFPAAYIVKALKYGADELCECCKNCNSTGNIDKKTCATCNGAGILNNKGSR